MWLRGWINQTAASLWVAAVSMVLVFALGRLLGPERFGEYNYVLTLASLIAILQDGGFKTLLQRESAHRSMDLEADRLTRYALGHILLVSLVAVCLAAVLGADRRVAMAWAIVAMALLAVANILSARWRGVGEYARDALWQAGVRSITAMLILGCVMLWRPDSTAVFVGWACGLALALAAVRFTVFPHWNPPGRVYRTAAAFMLIDLATTVYFRIDIVLMEQLGVAPADIGRYAAAYRLFEGGVLLLAPAATVFFRELRLRWQDQDAARALLRRALGGVLLLAAAGSAVVHWFAEPLLVLAYGDSYAAAAPLLSWLLVAFLFLAPNYVLTQAAVALGRERWYAATVCIAAAVNVGLNFWLLPRFGALGAAWASIATEAVLMVLLYRGVRSWL
ncbi:oligosaccharide flippase family protein [Paracidovorax cattleyae]|uniref:Membrane protein involved in the export of O-antigen and teichoic acid n=1 Tax=Paracidovorax cattleyae TaxID=80868 RepID=A0A1H0SCL1_9BURK|nr:polysaccharide biosynthesis C-terminal domain-containing protein [Paracidovorax cattleyae]AVS73273.1 polysaccharide biosynthesis protein [Paracidovorax cattleyae]MBF9264415.1 polysaccharide biosynthesis C-terminal domain-containing protein [Paracidovorax cattleyae]SDP39405.1 Membrane protein involved in the export of O-antigen and teichoic acid [Paracidovorax cattleyae]